MADVYRMPVPTVPADPELDDLADRAQAWATSTEVAQGARQCLRLQAAAIRALRIRLAAVESKLESTEAIAAIARDERVAEAIEAQGECEGSGCPPEGNAFGQFEEQGRCPICGAVGPMDGEVIGTHERPDPPVPAS